MFSQASRRVVRKIKDTAGRPIWTPSYDEGITSQTPDRLLGYPVYINNDMPTMAANAKSIAFGNFNRYLIRDAMDVTMFRFDDSAFMSKGQVGYLAWCRAGGNLLDLNSVKQYQNSAT
jgi:HK97 family phage major capsid protein